MDPMHTFKAGCGRGQEQYQCQVVDGAEVQQDDLGLGPQLRGRRVDHDDGGEA